MRSGRLDRGDCNQRESKLEKARNGLSPELPANTVALARETHFGLLTSPCHLTHLPYPPRSSRLAQRRQKQHSPSNEPDFLSWA